MRSMNHITPRQMQRRAIRDMGRVEAAVLDSHAELLLAMGLREVGS